MAKRNRDPDPNEVLATIDPQPVRRVFTTGVVGLLGAILLYVAAATPPVDPAWLVFLIVTGFGALYLAWRVWLATAVTLELTRSELREAGGRVLFSLDEVDSIDRSVFAFKPAGGFLVRLKAPTTRGRVYAPALWWRARRRVAVGGATAGSQAKPVADLISIILAERRGDLPRR
ncbi:hypothetical protein [Roseicyclus mahoneyensis]|jgi:hypothetical protein|uniref:PH (Pleckstrin Homology) domain-containing protein n=1 Tax=Roseicyclus mahoneyensis TaxID=164332 RepID=A0A316GIX7_9RHOB|nr:hypothetical protein [Roseicyclus mahoneyensis]PWK60912.1 hypothetical protein C7455_103110 [Roseicyclus mahoneyensis]